MRTSFTPVGYVENYRFNKELNCFLSLFQVYIPDSLADFEKNLVGRGSLHLWHLQSPLGVSLVRLFSLKHFQEK